MKFLNLFEEFTQSQEDVLLSRLEQNNFYLDSGELSGRGYILRDGQMLKMGDDHRMISGLYYDQGDGLGDIETMVKLSSGSSSENMIDFMSRMGAIRYQVARGELSFSNIKRITPSQRRALTSREFSEVNWTVLDDQYRTLQDHDRLDYYEFLELIGC